MASTQRGHRPDNKSLIHVYRLEDLPHHEFVTEHKVAPLSLTMAEYSSLLSDLSENITNEDLEQLKSACKEDIPEDQSNNITSSKEWFSYLEKNDKLAQDNLSYIEHIFEISRRPDLLTRVIEYRTTVLKISEDDEIDTKLTRIPSAKKYKGVHIESQKWQSYQLLSTAGGGEICIGNEIRDSFSLLDVLCANEFEGESFNLEFLEQTEINFYRGAPPEWLNFHMSELAESDGAGTPLIKRDGYKTLVGEIYKKKRVNGTSTIKLFHQQGCGGTTLAMQVLWDLRKNFRCAVLKGSASHITNIAKEVVDLFTAGSQGNQNTVLLLLNNEQILENLQDSIMEEIAEQELDTDMPVVILFSCVRASDHVILEKEDSYTVKQHKRKYVILKKELSDTEKQKFNEKKEELCRRYSEKYKHFHGFNIMQTNFSQAYIQEACTVFTTIKKTNRHQLVPQLAAFLSLLNAYVPGSYLLESQCLDFLKRKDSVHEDLSLEDRMEPFNGLIVIFQQDKRFEKKVCMAHPMIAQHCIELMDQGRVSRSDTARNFLTCFCGDEVPPFLFSFIKDMLTKREMKNKINDIEKDEKEQKGREEDQEKFSRLILDIKEREDEKQSASVLKVASNKFAQNSLFPQALARFYYIELKDYNKAEMWAETGKERDPNKSFIADTLGQVHKNHLKNKKRTASNDEKTFPRQILQLAAKAIDAFQHEEHLAENERRKDMKEDGKTKVLRALNTRGQLGYLQVCNLLYDLLVSQNEIWKSVLTKSLSLGSVLGLLGDGKLFRFNDLINSLRDEVEKRYLRPLFFMGNGKGLSRNVHRRVLDILWMKDALQDSNTNWRAERIFKDPLVQERLLKVEGVVRNYRLYATFGGTEIELDVNQRNNLWKSGQVSFYLGFTINGPVAYSIQPRATTEDHNSTTPDMFAVLHVDSCGDFVEQVSEVTSSHVKLFQPVFSPRGTMILKKLGFPVKVRYDVLIFKTIKTALTLHVYLVPRHPILQQAVEREEKSDGSKRIRKPNPDKSLQTENHFFLSTETDSSEISPDKLKLRYEGRSPNFFEVFIRNAKSDFSLKLESEQKKSREKETIWSCTIRTDDYQNRNTDHEQGQHFVDRHWTALVNRVRETGAILDLLKDRGLISNESYDSVRSLNTTQDQMRDILKFVTSAGQRSKDLFYEILKGLRCLQSLISELEGSR
ncbi:hypothetical protein L3Q82_003993 [Scortum barcoo]|uniref:Uncharacterized protein n=1 Tax=Scortum barcoo TaxID=214431 RepID=A0ACB8X5V6_9TELE|nr:hypothetical protein L3Q82_003993 [Scortum barcoo]